MPVRIFAFTGASLSRFQIMLKAFVVGLTLLGTSCLATSCGADSGGPRVSTEAARPALWRISDADTTIYLFGTIHMLPPGASWRSAAVDAAIADSKAAYFETDIEGDPRTRTELVQRLGLLDPSRRLSDMLTPDKASVLAAAAARVGYPMSVLETQRPWFAAVTLSDAAIRAAGYASDEGVETVLRGEAEAAGKEVRFLETMERQLSALSDLPEAVQLRYLAYSVSDIETVGPALASMVNAWRAGDVAALSRLLIDEDMARLPEMQDALLTRRNAEWAAQLKSLLDAEPGHFFVAVGAAHFAGEEGLMAQLKLRGVASERLQ
ncbi:MAG: TraB/GumN family protein [Hyphomonadaceae bacterium]